MSADSMWKRIVCIMDTDIVIDYLRRRDYAVNLVTGWAADGLLAVSTLTHYEIYVGLKKREQERTAKFLSSLVSIPVDISIAQKAGTISGQSRLKGKTIHMADAVIAATALQLGTPLLTNNVEHYPFLGLKVIRGLKS